MSGIDVLHHAFNSNIQEMSPMKKTVNFMHYVICVKNTAHKEIHILCYCIIGNNK